MLRAVAKWYISRAIDCDRTLPKWVAKRLQSDRHLQHFHRQALQLASRLQTAGMTARSREMSFTESQFSDLGRDAGAEQVAYAPDASKYAVSKYSGRSVSVSLGVAVGLAAAVLLMIAPWFKAASPPTTPEQIVRAEQAVGPEVNAPASVPPNDVDAAGLEELKVLLAASRGMMQSVNTRATEWVEPLAEPVLDAQQMADLLQFNFDQLDFDQVAEQVAEQVVEPTEQVGTRYGQMLTGVDKQLAEDNRRMIAGGVEAWKYFTYHVPQQAASLAGWPGNRPAATQ